MTKKNTPNNCSVSEAARWIGCARQTLTEWLNEAEMDYSNGVDVPAFLKWKFKREREVGREETRKKYAHVEETIEEAQAAGWIDEGEAKRRKLVADMAIREMERDERAGLLVRIIDVAQVVQDEFAIVREDILNMPGQLAPELEGKDYDERKEVIAEYVNKTLSELQADARFRKEGQKVEEEDE